MNHYKNVDLASKYNVSESTVRNWIKMARDGRLELTLSQKDGRTYVANISSNIPIIERLVEENKKYRNSRTAKTVAPQPEFYKVFSQTQIYDIVRNLEIRREIPRQYNYFDGGADKWDEYVEQLANEKVPNLLNGTVGLIADNQSYLDKRLAKYRHVNVVDIGVGDALPVKDLLKHLLDLGVLGRYMAIDISGEMLEIAKRNIKKWFNGHVVFEGYQMDITFERFANILAEDYLKKGAKDAANLVLFLGGTADNLRNPDDAFRTINESMNPNDLLLYSNKLETPDMRPQWFDYNSQPGKLTLAPMHRLVFDLLNIDDSFYDVEMGFDRETRQRYARTKLKVGLTLKFDFEDGERTIEFEKGDTILLWRSWQMSATGVAEQFDRNGFYILHSSQTEDREYIFTVAEVKHG
jgi:uncharacterized SAM-dependent methyltransferase/transposase